MPQLVSKLGEWLWALWLAFCLWQWLHPAFPLKCEEMLLPTLPGRQYPGQSCCGVWAWPQRLDHALFMLVAEVNADWQKPGKEQEILYELCMLWEQCWWWEGKCPSPHTGTARLYLEALTLNYMINVPAGALSTGYISKCHSLNRPFHIHINAHLRSKGQASACVCVNTCSLTPVVLDGAPSTGWALCTRWISSLTLEKSQTSDTDNSCVPWSWAAALSLPLFVALHSAPGL